MPEVNRSKVVVVGAGNVGESVCYALAVRGNVSEIAIVDVAANRAEGAAIDINDALAFEKNIKVYFGTYEDCADAGIIIVSAGVGRKPGQTRLDLAKININIAKSVATEIKKYAIDPIIIVIANPSDVLTYVIQEVTGYDPSRVIGTGTLLDSARLRTAIAEELNVNVTDVNANVLGEHGDSQVAIWSQASVAGVPLESYCKQVGNETIMANKAQIAEDVKKKGARIIGLKGATYLGVALNTSHIVDCIINDSHALIPVCHVCKEEYYGQKDLALNLLCQVGKAGIEKVIDMALTDEEVAAMENSAKVLKEFTDSSLGK